MGETRVDLLHLLEDLRDAYPGSLEETILTEVVANALDSGATSIHLYVDPAATTIAAVDDGAGMSRRELARYHDIATSSKRRGEGIGFGGVGIKLGLLVSEEVLTETGREASHVATSWRLASRTKAPWRWVPPVGLVPSRGTAVRLMLSNALSPLRFTCVSIRLRLDSPVAQGQSERWAIEPEVARLPFLSLVHNPRFYQCVGMMAQQGQADTGMLRHLGSGGFIAAPAEKVDDAQAPWLTQGLEHGGALCHGNGCRCSDWHGIKYTRLEPLLK